MRRAPRSGRKMAPANGLCRRKVQETGSAEWLRGLFDRTDAKNTSGRLEYLSQDARFRFGSAPPLVGKGAIQDGVNAFFSSLSEITHDIVDSWTFRDVVICQGEVTYTRPDSSTLTIPFANVFKLDGHGFIREYLIYADISGL